MPVPKHRRVHGSVHRKDDLARDTSITLRASHFAALDTLLARLDEAGIHISRSRLVQYAVEQLEHDTRIARVLDAPYLEPLENP